MRTKELLTVDQPVNTHLAETIWTRLTGDPIRYQVLQTHPNQARLHHTTTTKPAISYSSCPDRHQKQSHQDTYQTHHVGTHLHQRRLQTCQLTMGGNGFTTAPASASSHTTPCSFSGKEPKKKRICALPGFLSYQHPSTTGPKYRNHDHIRESTSRAQQQGLRENRCKTTETCSLQKLACRTYICIMP